MHHLFSLRFPLLTHALYICGEKNDHFKKPMKTYWNTDLNIGKEGISTWPPKLSEIIF